MGCGCGVGELWLREAFVVGELWGIVSVVWGIVGVLWIVI